MLGIAPSVHGFFLISRKLNKEVIRMFTPLTRVRSKLPNRPASLSKLLLLLCFTLLLAGCNFTVSIKNDEGGSIISSDGYIDCPACNVAITTAVKSIALR